MLEVWKGNAEFSEEPGALVLIMVSGETLPQAGKASVQEVNLPWS
jgi:hypothetical protein